MKTFFKKLLKTVLIFILSTIVLYCILTANTFYRFFDAIDIHVFSNTSRLPDSNKVQRIGDTVEPYLDLLEEELAKSPYLNDGQEHSITDGHMHSLGEFYDPLSFAIWAHLQNALYYIFTKYILISILLGIAIAIAYAVITSKKINVILKIVIGYVAIILLIPQILMFSITHNLYFVGNISAVYFNPKLIYFYIGYTILFILMYVINYIIGKKMTKKLNETIQETNK